MGVYKQAIGDGEFLIYRLSGFEFHGRNKQIEATSHLVHLSLKVAFLKKPAEDNMNPSHSETTQQSLEMKKERATRKKHKRVDRYIG